MDKRDYIISILLLIIIIATTVMITLKVDSCNDPEYTTLQRDSTLQKRIDSIYILRQELERVVEIQDSAIMNNQSGIIANENYFRKVMNDFMKSQKVKKSLPLNEQWNNYLKELDNE